MEPLTLQLRHGDEETIECWDDDGDLQCIEDIQFRTASSATSVTNSSVRRSGHRDSVSSRRSARSDIDSNAGGDEDWQVQLHENDDPVNEEAIASAKSAGIPLPTNVPKSALIGGTIKRLGRKKPKKNFVDDWSEDVELPGPDSILQLKTPRATVFPDSLRHINSAATSPVKSSASPFWNDDVSVRLQSSVTTLNRFRDEYDTGDIEDVPTIKVAKSRSPQKAVPISDFRPSSVEQDVENFDDDFELPADNCPLQLSSRKTNTRNLSPAPEDFDVDWSEGSIGVRFGGTARDRRSNPSSTVSVVSPSVSSCLTGESEDDGLDGLVIPEGPLNLETSLKRQQDPKLTSVASRSRSAQDPANTDDFFSGIEIEGDDVFTPGKLSLNPNVKCKTERPESPVRRSATTITFTNTAVSPKTRIPRLPGHDRPHSTHLETVSESGAPLSTFRRSQSRLGGHSSHSSISSLPHSETTSVSPTPITPGRRLVGTRVSKNLLADERAPAGKQLLKNKRSMPAMRNIHQVTSTSFQCSPSEDGTSRFLNSSTRPKTPVDLMGNDTRPLTRRLQAPFIPAGASENQSHHAKVKSYRNSRRTNSDSSGDSFSPQGPVTRLPRPIRPEPFSNKSNQDALAGTTKRTLTKPTRRRNFGDGTELESFDDLPTSFSAESRFVKHPIGRGAPRSLKSKLSQSRIVQPPMGSPPQPRTPVTPKPHDVTPRFARDTNASRNAREQRIASMTMSLKTRENNPLASLSSNWKAQTISRMPSSSASIRSKKRKPAMVSGKEPHLIKPMGAGVQEAKSVNGMRYNPVTFCWEGNENLVQDFDAASPKSPKPAPALITNVGAMQNVQVVGGMVFDPRRMCWLKLASLQPGNNGLVAVQDEDDVFAGLDDLEENALSSTPCARSSGAFDDLGLATSGDERSGGEESDEWPITEEFDVGPEFIRRQRAEEEKWRRKVDKWVCLGHGNLGDSWRWTIRDLVGFSGAPGAQRFNDN
ncbi:hypothetical protein ASPWEDRAFT_115474 [Aspergillus wentii DTO 134E9]|uniref:Cytokinesis regulator (Byr4) n=1 Tax=Aspergillus wentii DTO 134E9 TaxID=1073089 RepID=A0A1L9RDW3_ASPWE|nr:uncharacterized protein ASPWEDRAFT_115474 [Aspergillus wentii DTO 134E9]KAI9933372.1 hypothetical protein MW887_007845 [Aspergillus wentii]OJJ33105.1 hypothetical protein ASPWEDRAFT_115474 [Aspergillus wentii DTO 134E9]